MAGGKRKWIKKAISHPGALTEQAKRAGRSPMEFAREHQGDSGKTGQRARLAMTLQGMHPKHERAAKAMYDRKK